ncbi:hypothetical protein GCM10023172_30990 [Hymenobacter ginsengisoli]|uniref:Uncharacterized protein n=1 Tax=Hymenobacter ginsengisoli TaxID=1051626 RepID=A0ABP8QK80_9BACT|nr:MULTISPECIES: hypothetical protein [unclassified Hymenobacter]MBO2033288.1 hypothetical protein [Hymenobacter sp. BT559]
MRKPIQNKNEAWVRVPNRGDFELNYLIKNIEEALREKDNFSPKLYSEIYDDFSHVHCEICWGVIANRAPEVADNSGYYADHTWVCQQCYTMFVVPERYLDAVASLERIATPA